MIGVRDWCAAHVSEDLAATSMRGVSHEELVSFLRWWGGELRSSGLLAPHWPREWGGGFSVERAGRDSRGAGPRRCARGTRSSMWPCSTWRRPCSTMRARSSGNASSPGSSTVKSGARDTPEPNAGSDLASLQTRADTTADRYIVNGQKVWTSWAREADWCMLPRPYRSVRGERTQGHQLPGVDMHSAGIEVRPIQQAWGPADFNEVLLRRDSRAGREPHRT